MSKNRLADCLMNGVFVLFYLQIIVFGCFLIEYCVYVEEKSYLCARFMWFSKAK